MLPAESWNAWCHVADGWSVFALTGPDALDWLQRQGTQDVRKLDTGGMHWNAFLNRFGEIECLFLMVRAGDNLLVLIPPGFRNAFEERVERYVILEDLAARPLYDDAPVLILAGSDASAALAFTFSLTSEAVPLLTGSRPEPVELDGVEGLVWPFTWGRLSGFFMFPSQPDRRTVERLTDRLKASGVVCLSALEWQILTDLAGYPIPRDARVLLSETPWDLAALSENKGCYPGQEVVARLRAYGSVRRRLMALRWHQHPNTALLLSGVRLYHEDGSPAGRVFRHFPIPGILQQLADSEASAVTLCWMDKSCREPGIRLRLRGASGGSWLGEAEVADLPVWILPDGREKAEIAAARARRWFEEDPEDTDPRPVAEITRALLLDPGRSEYYETLTVMLIRRKQYGDALPVARAWIRRFPEEVMAYSNLSLVLAHLGCTREAEAAKDTARRLATARDYGLRQQETVSEDALRQRARAEAEERVELFREALEYDPDDTVALMGLGVALQTLDRPEEAGRCFRRALEIDSSYSAAWLRLGECLDAEGDRRVHLRHGAKAHA